MLEMILAALRATGIEEYIVTEEISQTAEMYFVRRKLDMPRMRDVTEYRVKVYREFVYSGERMKGESEIKLAPGVTALEVQQQLIKAYEAAQYVRNKFFEAAEPVTGPEIPDIDAEYTPERLCTEAANVLFSADDDPEAFINSAEIFGTAVKVRI